jgi:uncharacterized protein
MDSFAAKIDSDQSTLSLAPPPRVFSHWDLPLVLLLCLGVFLAAMTLLLGLQAAFVLAGSGRFLEEPAALLAVMGFVYMAAIGAIALRLHNRPGMWAQLGLAHWPQRKHLILSAVAGFLLPFAWVIVPGVERPLPFITSYATYVGALVVASVLAPMAEELLFRGVVYRWVKERAGMATGVAVSAISFSLAHMDPALVNMGHLAFIGVVMAFIYERTRSLWCPIAAHAAYNMFVASANYMNTFG